MTLKTCRYMAILILGAIALAAPASAAPRVYDLDVAKSHVGFHYTLNGIDQTGTMPVSRAKITIDPNHLAASRVDVTLAVTRAKTDLFFATDAIKSAEILDVKRFPEIRFVSTSIKLASNGRLSDGARISGNLTIRGQTRPVTLDASLFRPPGSAAHDLSNLTVRLAGSISRAAFGASGYAGLVGDIVKLDITAVIHIAVAP